jgi:hypothetical protein
VELLKGEATLIRFWYDESERKLIIFHELSGKEKELKFGSKDLARFLEAHNVTLKDCKKVKRDKDRLGLYKRPRFWCKWWRVK